MATNDFYEGVAPENYEQKCALVFVLDRSGSMSGTPIQELNKGLQLFATEIKQDPISASRLDIAVVSFGSDTKVERSFGLVDESPMPNIAISGSTRLVDGTRKGISLLEERKAWYKSTGQTYYRPYLILITDGAPDSGQDVDGLATEIETLATAKKLNFWPIAVEGANLNILEKLAAPQIKGCLPVMPLKGLQFVELFKWLSASFSTISKSKEGESADIKPDKDNNPFMFDV